MRALHRLLRGAAGRSLLAQSAFGEPLRVLLDAKPGKAAAKRWDWVRKGAPLIVEVGPRDMADGKVAVLRRDRLWNDAAKPNFAFTAARRIRGRCRGRAGGNPATLYDQAGAAARGRTSSATSPRSTR